MCLMLYIGSRSPVAARSVGSMVVGGIPPERAAGLAAILGKPELRLVAERGGCSCDFPHEAADEPFDFYEGLFDADDPDDRRRAVQSVRDLLVALSDPLRVDGEVVLFSMWDDGKVSCPKGSIDLRVGDIAPEQFFFLEDFVYTLRP